MSSVLVRSVCLLSRYRHLVAPVTYLRGGSALRLGHTRNDKSSLETCECLVLFLLREGQGAQQLGLLTLKILSLTLALINFTLVVVQFSVLILMQLVKPLLHEFHFLYSAALTLLPYHHITLLIVSSLIFFHREELCSEPDTLLLQVISLLPFLKVHLIASLLDVINELWFVRGELTEPLFGDPFIFLLLFERLIIYDLHQLYLISFLRRLVDFSAGSLHLITEHANSIPEQLTVILDLISQLLRLAERNIVRLDVYDVHGRLGHLLLRSGG